MKIEIKEILPLQFLMKQPVITLETQEEIDSLYAILNYTLISNALDLSSEPWVRIYDKLSHFKTNGYQLFHEKLRQNLI